MIVPKNLEDLAALVEKPEKIVLFFSADWCGDCRYIKPFLPEIEAENPDFTFVLVDRDAYLELAQQWNVFGIPSLIVLENGREISRLVNRNRKTKAEINEFLGKIRG